jgi:hypothetical protein
MVAREMNGEVERASRGLVEARPPLHFPGEPEEISAKPVRMAGVRPEIRTEHLPDISRERSRCTNLFGYIVTSLGPILYRKSLRDVSCRLMRRRPVSPGPCQN